MTTTQTPAAAVKPAVTQLPGPANWWLPDWIELAIPSLYIEPNGEHRAGGGLIRPQPISAEAAT